MKIGSKLYSTPLNESNHPVGTVHTTTKVMNEDTHPIFSYWFPYREGDKVIDPIVINGEIQL